MKKKTLSQSLRETVEDLATVLPVKKTLKQFDQLEIDEAFDKYLEANWKKEKTG